MTTPLIIATRESPLALWQAEHVATLLRHAHPGLDVALLPMTTQGDRRLDQSLALIGGKGLFIKELEVALLDGRADLAVHSMKDLPAALPEGLRLAALLEGADPRDALVLPAGTPPGSDLLSQLPAGARVGTSSLRRACQLLALRPDLRITTLRGNLQTRLAKLDAGNFDAIVLAVAGLVRLGLASRISERLATDTLLPAVGQGVVGIEARAGDGRLDALLTPLHHPPTLARVSAERTVNRVLGGSCQLPLAAHAAPTADGGLRLRALVGSSDGQRCIRADAVAPVCAPEALGQQVAQALLDQGAEALLNAALPSHGGH